MNQTKVNALATSIIAFVTVIGVIIGTYYNLTTTGTKILYIVYVEILFISIVVLFTLWVKEELGNE